MVVYFFGCVSVSLRKRGCNCPQILLVSQIHPDEVVDCAEIFPAEIAENRRFIPIKSVKLQT